ncbi:MAG: hypothetical protein FIB01_05700 [Gemmatimonadetes bacterium]|nr:hypothetical protein [Gemmatimonadota bacterium]
MTTYSDSERVPGTTEPDQAPPPFPAPPDQAPLPFPAPPDQAPPPFPWPPGERDPVVDALAETWRAAVFRPGAFFAALPGTLSLGAALLYYLLIGIVSAAIRLFWSVVLATGDDNFLDAMFPGTLHGSPLVEFLTSPLTLLLSLFLAAGMTHLLVLAFVPQARGFGRTLRVYCFAYSPALCAAIPYVGSLVAFFWMTALSVVGVRVTHATSGARATAAVLLPLVLAVLFLALAYALLNGPLGLLEVTRG